ncbi:MAG: DUF3365 domain-containing protein [Spirochaetia bacterium]|nr:DUF3365 domain-containing protein [Spirochaetia bacterium]
MNKKNKSIQKNKITLIGLSIYTKFLAIFVVTAVCVTGAYLLIGLKFNSLQYKREASGVSNQVIAFIQWISQSKYIYIDASENKSHTDFNESLLVKEFDKDGKKYKFFGKDMLDTSKEFSKLYSAISKGAKFRVTSERYLDLKNKPDEFELKAIEYFKKQNSGKESGLYYEETKDNIYRYASPIYIVASCLACHGDKKDAPKELIAKYGDKKAFGYKLGDIRGIVTVNIPQMNIIELLQTFFSDVFLASMLLFSVTIINFIWFRKIISKPLQELTIYADKLSQRNYKAEVSIKSKDELGLLADTMQFMAADIDSHIQSLEESKKRIEDNVNNLKLMNTTFHKFVPNEFLSFLGHEDITKIGLGDQIEKEMSILFSDIREFTKLSEAMTPEENFNFLNRYLNDIGPVINHNNGFIDKYIGDAIMALFPQSPEDAVQAAIDIQKGIKNFNELRELVGSEPIRAGIGIHHGTLMLGTIGYRQHMQTTVISDTVNLASRIEGLTKFFDARILISEPLLNKLKNKNQFRHRFLGNFNVKGKLEQIPAYEIYEADDDEIIEAKDKSLERFEEAAYAFRNKNFERAHKLFIEIINECPNDSQAAIYLDQCKKQKII